MARTSREYRCSFCGKTQDQVKRMIAGPNYVYICDECVSLCNEIIAEESSSSHGRASDQGGGGHATTKGTEEPH